MITERRLFLFEADEDDTTAATDNTNDNTAENNDTSAENDTAETDDNNTEENKDDQQDNEENKEEDNNEDQNDDNQEDDNDQNDDDDFSIGDDDQNNDDNENSDDNSSSGNDSENKQKSDELKAKDRELFDSLSLAEQQIKIKELKQNFGELYSNCSTLIDRYNEISIEFENNHFNRIVSCLIDLKGMISFYILNLYDLKSYFENDIIFNRYLAIFNSIKTTTGIINSNLKGEEDKE